MRQILAPRTALQRIVLAALLAVPAYPWGVTGHHVVALIAERRLSPEVRDRIGRLLFNGKYTLRDISACADDIRSSRAGSPTAMCAEVAGALTQNTSPWHYIDIPLDSKTKEFAKYCPHDDCITAQLERFTRILRESNDDAERRTALLFVVHFMGDIHQPLHCEERACDQGGNRELVNFYMGNDERADAHLHRVWDSDLVDKLMRDAHVADEQALASLLLDRLDPDNVPGWLTASAPQIAWEGHELARKKAYRGIRFQDFCTTPPPKPHAAIDLSAGYENAGVHVVREQLTKAGVRLAGLLETNLTH